MLEASIAGFDAFWEKEPIAEALTALVPLLKGESTRGRRREAIAQLYRINPGALPQAGIGLPFAVSFQGSDWQGREKALVLRFLRRTGSECEEGIMKKFPFTLLLTKANDNCVRWAVLDSSGSVVKEANFTLAGGRRKRSAAFVHALLEELYSVH
jgi:hypothetical protein